MSFTRLLGVSAAAIAALITAVAHPGSPARGPETPARRGDTPVVARQDLGAAIQQAIAATGLKKATIGVSVRDAQSGAVLVEVAGWQPLMPASNMKVLTTGAALHTLGPDFMFRTKLLRDGDRLTVVGDGDPSFGDPTLLEQMVFVDANGNRQVGLTVDGLLDRWVDAVKRAGVQQVRELVVDDRVFDREFVHPQWPADQLSNGYCAQVSGLNFHTNVLHAFIRQSGGRGEVTRWTPAAPWLQVTNRSTANTEKKATQSVWLGRTDDPAVFTLNGNVKAAPVEPIAMCVNDMPAFFARMLAERLRAAGIPVATARSALATDTAPAGQAIGPVVQTPLKTVVQRCNTDSQNLYAESLLKRMGFARAGQSGSWANGGAALAAAIDERLGAGMAARGLVVSDGSGLSRMNRVAPNLVSAWLQSIAADPKLRDAFIESMAVAGETGTVAKRFKDLDTTKVFAPCKTGYINGVSCLSGFVGPVGGPPRFTFSVLCNDLTEPDAVGKAKQLQERVVKALAGAL